MTEQYIILFTSATATENTGLNWDSIHCNTMSANLKVKTNIRPKKYNCVFRATVLKT